MRFDSIGSRAAIIAALALAATPAIAAPMEVQWGASGDVPLPADYDNDGRADFVVWRPSDGYWHLRYSSDFRIRSVQWGMSGDVPVPGEYDGDGFPDFVVYRPSNGLWFVKNYFGVHVRTEQWGSPGDIPVPGDYDGDGRTDFAVLRPGSFTWLVKSSATGIVYSQQWGQAGDIPVQGKYDAVPGDDFAIFRPSTGQWWAIGGVTRTQLPLVALGAQGDRPVTARLCGDLTGRTVFRPNLGQWKSVGQADAYLGVHEDLPVAANFFTEDTAADRAVWRPSTGMWYVEPSVCDRWAPTNARVVAATSTVRGVTVATVKNGAVAWHTGAGMANATHPATSTIPFQLASISKLFVGTAVMQLVEAGILEPDASSGLTSAYNSSWHPTLRHLAKHAGSVRTGAPCGNWVFNGTDPTRNLHSVVHPCFFGPNSQNMWRYEQPGTIGDYSNLGIAWTARMVEMATGRDFAAYTREEIFEPLAMNSTGWFLSDFGNQAVAQGYYGLTTPSNNSGFSPYPVGNLRASALDLTRFMILWLGGGSAFGQTLLAPQTVTDALTLTGVTNFGMFWAREQTPSGHGYWGHGGILGGICTRLGIDPATNTGIVVLTNGNCDVAGTHIDAIFDRGFKALTAP